jgi:hypothetical protein
MIDGLGVAGWGVGGIEAEAAMLGQVSMGCLLAYSKITRVACSIWPPILQQFRR